MLLLLPYLLLVNVVAFCVQYLYQAGLVALFFHQYNIFRLFLNLTFYKIDSTNSAVYISTFSHSPLFIMLIASFLVLLVLVVVNNDKPHLLLTFLTEYLL